MKFGCEIQIAPHTKFAASMTFLYTGLNTKGCVTLGKVLCNLSHSFVTTQGARKIA